MFHHKNVATEGFFPGLTSHMQVATVGLFETEVIIEPVVRRPSGGGGFGRPLAHEKPTHFRVTVRVKYKGKWYQDTQIVDESEARVIAELKGIKSFSTGNVMVSVNGIQIFEQEQIKITVNKIGIIN